MRHRGYLSRPERLARSRLAKLLHDRPFLCGSLVKMQRVCGKQGCKCMLGELHPSLYLAIRVGEKRKMIHIPQALEATARQWVATYQESWQLMEKISQVCLERFFKDKEKERGKRG